MLTISDIVAHLERAVTTNRLSQDRLIYDLKCFQHRSNRRYAAERLDALTVENDVIGDLLRWIRDNLNGDDWIETQPTYSPKHATHQGGALNVFNEPAEIALDDMHCDVLV